MEVGHSQSEDAGEFARQWEEVLRAGVEAQRLVGGSIAVGGTAAALYAHHRLSIDTDHLLPDLTERFEEVREILEHTPSWKTARVVAPKLILGSLGSIQVGFRQMIRTLPVETNVLSTATGPLVVPTLEEMIGMKAYLAYSRHATRDFLDFAALSKCADEKTVIGSLLRSDERYGELQTDSVALEIAKTLAEPMPFDLDSVDLVVYKGVRPPWNDWSHIESICECFGIRMIDELLREGGS
ncbi:MAG: hypothetical protein WD851_05990 [Pirellulales bacterium]